MNHPFTRMVKFILRLLSIAILCSNVYVPHLYAQSKKADDLTISLENFTKEFPQEKVYLHTDKTYYSPGESIWFQTYITSGPENQPSSLSQPLYVQLIDNLQKLITQKVIKTTKGFGAGVIDVTDSLITGNYTLVAFTNWMRNFDEDFFFRKKISIINDIQPEREPVNTDNEKTIDLQFFPEGGNLIQEIPSKVAFKAIGPNGRSVKITGEIIDSKGTHVANLETAHEGMGFFYLTPLPGESYSAKIEGNEKTFALPLINESGLAMRVVPTETDILKLTITQNGASSSTPLTLLIHREGSVVFSATVDVSKTMVNLNVPIGELTSGIYNITLFDETNNPLLERLYFVENVINYVTMTSDKESYGTREKVSLKLNLDYTVSDTLNAVFSVSAYDIGQGLDKEPESNIYTELLLNADLKGNIENPIYYFNEENPEAKQHLDLVMLTHGWSRFKWDEVLNSSDKQLGFEVETGLSLKGISVRAFTDKPQPSNISLINKSKMIPDIIDLQSQEDGGFWFRNLDVFEGDDIILKGSWEKGTKKKPQNDIQFKIDSTIYPAPTVLAAASIETINDRLNAVNERFLEQRATREKIDAAYNFDPDVRRLDDVIVEDSKNDIIREDLENTTFGRGTNAYDFTTQKNLAGPEIFDALIGKIPGLTIRMPKLIGDSRIVFFRNIGITTVAPLFLLDDIPVDIQQIQMMAPDQFYKVVAFKGLPASARFGSAGLGGALAFYTKTGAGLVDERFEKEDGLISLQLNNSYQLTREFYSPKYDIEKPEHIKPDYRLLLHWQPMILLGPDNKVTLEFWTSDLETTVLINVQGLMVDGTPVSNIKYFEIKK